MGRKEAGVAALVLLALVLLARAFGPAGETAEHAALRVDRGSDVPVIGLHRLGRAESESGRPERDVFKFGRESRADLFPVPAPVIKLQPTPIPLPTQEVAPTPTPWPTLNVSLIGIVDNGTGGKFASFVKDGEVVLVGRAGQVLGNAFRVVRIGTESAEIEELGSGRARRLPLRSN